MYAMHRWT